jgi:hypothetical protein
LIIAKFIISNLKIEIENIQKVMSSGGNNQQPPHHHHRPQQHPQQQFYANTNIPPYQQIPVTISTSIPSNSSTNLAENVPVRIRK